MWTIWAEGVTDKICVSQTVSVMVTLLTPGLHSFTSWIGWLFHIKTAKCKCVCRSVQNRLKSTCSKCSDGGLKHILGRCWKYICLSKPHVILLLPTITACANSLSRVCAFHYHWLSLFDGSNHESSSQLNKCSHTKGAMSCCVYLISDLFDHWITCVGARMHWSVLVRELQRLNG